MESASSLLILPTINFICAVLYILLSFYILIRNSEAHENRFGALIFLDLAIWSAAKTIVQNPLSSFELANYIENVSTISGFLITPLLLLLSFSLTDKKTLLNKNIIALIFFIPLVCLISQIVFDAIYHLVEQPFGWGVAFNKTAFAYLFVAHSLLYAIISIVLCLFKGIKTNDTIRRKQLILTSASMFTATLSAYMSNIFGPTFLSWQAPDLAHVFALFWLFGLLYAITQYNFLEPSPTIAADTLFNSAGDGIIISNINNIIVAANPASQALFNKTEQDFLDLSTSSFFEKYLNVKKEYADYKELRDLDCYIYRDDNSTLPVSVSRSAIPSQNNGDIGSVLIIRDISIRHSYRKQLEESHHDLTAKVHERTNDLTKANDQLQARISEHRKTADALQESETNFRALAEQSLVGIIILQDFNIVFSNKAWQNIIGYTHHEMAQWGPEGYLNVIHQEDREQVSENNRLILEGISTESTYDWRLLCKNGSIKWISMYSRSIIFKGKPSILATLIDTTRQKKMVETLKESEEKYRVLVENAHDVIYIIQDGFVKYANQKLFDITGYKLDEIYSTHIFELVHPEDRAYVEARYNERIEGKTKTRVLNYRVIAKDKRTVWVRNTSVLYSWRKRPALLCFAIDTTAEKEMENMLNHIQRRDAIGSMAGGIAHDLNNILSPILGFSEVLQDELPPHSETREAADQIVTASLRAKELVQQILSFSKQQPLKKEHVPLHKVVHEACKLCKAVIPKKISFSEQIEITDGHVEADPTQMHQVVMNLLTNAYQALGNQGSLEVSLKRTDNCLFAKDSEETYLKLTVKDSGNGISSENMQKIFDPYFSTKTKGTGLGLTTVMAIVSELKGFVDVKSIPAQGTSFILYLPESKTPVSQQPLILPNMNEKGLRKKILIIDDEKPIVTLFTNLLERQGYNVAAFNNAQEAIEDFTTNGYTFDLVITDMSMPQINGSEVAKHVQKIKPGCPIILCTGYNESLTAEEARELGVSEFLQKPVSTKILTKTVASLLF